MSEQGDPSRTRGGRKWAVAGVGGGLALALVVGGILIGRELLAAPAPVALSPTPMATSTPVITQVPSPPPTEPGFEPAQVAHVTKDVARYDEPGGKRVGTVRSDWAGYASKLLVLDQRDGWLKVGLQRRPNQDSAWIKADGIKLTTTPYRIEISLAQRSVTLFKEGKRVFTAPTAIGKKSTPTPKGNYFVTMLAKPPSPGYGNFVVVLSAHSEAIQSFHGSGDAIIALHGPVGSDARIGKNGAVISNGCLRMHVADLDKLADVLPGTPVEIA